MADPFEALLQPRSPENPSPRLVIELYRRLEAQLAPASPRERSDVVETQNQRRRGNGMTRYLISFPSGAMDHIPEEESSEVARAAHAVVQEAKDAGVFFFAGGLDEDVEPVMVADDGTVTPSTYPLGGFTIVDVTSREAALEWAAKFAVACRCAQEVCEIGFDPLV